MRRAAISLVSGLVLGAGCGGRATATSAPADGPSCREVARRGEALIAQVPAAERDDATRFVAGVIDLCQTPGLAARARGCLAAAPSIADARACPALPATGEDGAAPAIGAEPGCPAVVAHALDVLARSPDAPQTPEDRAREERAYARECGEVSADGHRCALAAASVEELDRCFEAHPREGGADEAGDDERGEGEEQDDDDEGGW